LPDPAVSYETFGLKERPLIAESAPTSPAPASSAPISRDGILEGGADVGGPVAADSTRFYRTTSGSVTGPSKNAEMPERLDDSKKSGRIALPDSLPAVLAN